MGTRGRAKDGSLAALVARERDRILREWMALASRDLDERLEGPELADHVPAILDAIVAHLRAGGDGSGEAARFSKLHGRQRLRSGVDLRRVVQEYRVLGQVILAAAERAQVAPSWRDPRLLEEVLGSSAAEAAAEYAEQRSAFERDLEGRFREIADHAPGAVFVEGSDGRYRFVNRWFAELFGLAQEDFAGRTIRDLAPPDLAASIAEQERRAAAGEEVVTEDVLPTARGERVLMTVRFPYRFPSGERGVVGIAFDITDRRRAEDEARHAAELLELGDAFFELDRDWRIVRVNANQERLSRKPRAETLGRVFWEIWPDLAHPGSRYWIEYHRAMTERVPVQFEEYYEPLGMWTEVTAYPVSGDGIAVFFRDATERKRWEERLRSTREFEQHLLGIVSHDLRTPLGTILGSARVLMARGDLDESARRGIARMASAGHRATRMIADLLDLAAARLGQRIPVVPAETDLAGLCDEVVEEATIPFPGRRVQVSREGDLHGRWDRDRLAQLLGNLLTNALKYGAAGEPVGLELRGEGDSVVVRVRNAGAPIPPEMLPRIFEPLSGRQASGATPPGSNRGVGLGLFIVREVARAHGGTVAVESEVSSGTTFTVRLPRHSAASGAHAG